MADGVAITAGSGTTIATDDCGAPGHAQIVKLAISTDGSATAIPADASGLTVQLGAALPAGTAAIGKLSANSGVDIGDVDVTSIAAGTNYIGRVRLTDGTNDSNVSTTGALFVGGAVAHDGIDSGNPVKLGMRAVAHGANPTAVAAADRTDWLANRHGTPWVIGGAPNVQTNSVRLTGSSTDAAIIAGTISAGTKIVVTRLSITVSNATTVNVGVRVGFGATTLAADSTTSAAGILVDSDGFPPGGGINIGDGSGILGIGGDGEELRITNDAPTSGSVHVSCSYYTVDS